MSAFDGLDLEILIQRDLGFVFCKTVCIVLWMHSLAENHQAWNLVEGESNVTIRCPLCVSVNARTIRSGLSGGLNLMPVVRRRTFT